MPKKDFEKNLFNPGGLVLQDEFEREKEMERDPFNPEYENEHMGSEKRFRQSSQHEKFSEGFLANIGEKYEFAPEFIRAVEKGVPIDTLELRMKPKAYYHSVMMNF